MITIRRHSVFFAWMIGCGLLIALGAGWSWRLRKSVRLELASLERKNRQRAEWVQEVESADPLPTGIIAGQSDVSAVSVGESPVPRKSLDGFIAIAGAVEDMRRIAREQKVSLRPDEAFGFASYSHHGPADNDLSSVHQQLRFTQLVLGKLWAVRPSSLLGVTRESLRPKERPLGGEIVADFFHLDRRLDLRDGGAIGGRAIRLEFTAETAVLRAFLRSLAETPELFVVCSVEVAPPPPVDGAPGAGSKITVVVLQLEPPGTRRWPAGDNSRLANAARVGREYELFNPQRRHHGEEKTSLTAHPLVKTVGSGVPELLAVKREPFRLQLVGYYGAAGNYTATFLSAGSPEVLRAKVGCCFDSLGLILRDFAVKKVTAASDYGPSGFEVTASARLWDERAQAEVTLNSGEKLMTNVPLAVLRLGPAPAQPKEFREGDSYEDETAICRIERIQLAPAEVVIVREVSGRILPEKQILRPITSAPPGLTSVATGQ